ncbi:zinc finger MYM-type protein 5-like isoform X2 [Hydra vulgaris]|uniref:Zinc finger MYM-type protein 5-like isoform X2 n=1 Tax=Hydra vulgaris TaxID=6087 RepID=A0ABM4DK26_HYDVU
MSGFKKKDSGCQVRKNAAQRTANEEKNKSILQDCGITVTKKGEDESPTASNSFLPSQSIQAVGNETVNVTDISENSGEPLSKIGMVAVNEENILVLPTEEPIVTIPSNDPALWAAHLSKVERDSVLLQGLPQNPSAFPKDSNKKKVPESIFYETSLNGEKTCRGEDMAGLEWI